MNMITIFILERYYRWISPGASRHMAFRSGQLQETSVDLVVNGFRTLVLIATLVGTCLTTVTSNSNAATLRGQQVQGGKMIEIQFPIDKYYQDIAARDGNPRPQIGTAVL